MNEGRCNLPALLSNLRAGYRIRTGDLQLGNRFSDDFPSTTIRKFNNVASRDVPVVRLFLLQMPASRVPRVQ
jgi:hypothetical protein